ncbi:MAG: hypothetical protein WBM44_21310, partial [Waterburya sp.]
MKLCCNFGTQNQTVRSDVYLKQKNNCSIIATVIPCTFITLRAGTKGVYLSSVSASSSLLLAKTPVVISRVTINSSNTGWKQEFEVKISYAELKQNTIISNKVTIKIYLTNITYFHAPNTNINITGKPKITLFAFPQGQITHCAEINSVNYSDLDNIKDLVDSICWLISFASGQMASIARTEVFDENQLIYQEYISAITHLNSENKVIDDSEIVKFIENTYIYYFQNKDVYLLKGLINTGILANNNLYVETKTLLMSNFLEILRYNYALNIGCRKGFLKQKKDNFKWVEGINNNQSAYFKDILTTFCKANRILKSWDDLLKDIRNRIIHQGECLGNNIYERIENYNKLHHFCDRAILAILNWHKFSGHYIAKNNTNINPRTNKVLF